MNVRQAIKKGKIIRNDKEAIVNELIRIESIKKFARETFWPGTRSIILSESELEESLNDNHI